MSKEKVIIIDDEDKYRETLAAFLSHEIDVITYKHPDQFSQEITNPCQLSDVRLIVLDYCFDTFHAKDKELHIYIRKYLKYSGTMVLWSLEDDIPSTYRDHFDVVLPKRVFSLAEVDACISS